MAISAERCQISALYCKMQRMQKNVVVKKLNLKIIFFLAQLFILFYF